MARKRIVPIGSIGTGDDLRIMLDAACYEDGVDGHQWENRWTDSPAPADPKCKFCQRTMRSKMQRRGLSDSEIHRLFDLIDAPWPWGKRTDRVSKRQPKPRPAKEYRPGDNIVWVDALTDEMIAQNAEHAAAWENMVEQRGGMIEAGATADEAAKAYPMPKNTIYRAK